MTARHASASAWNAFGAKCSWKFFRSVDLPASDCPAERQHAGLWVHMGRRISPNRRSFAWGLRFLSSCLSSSMRRSISSLAAGPSATSSREDRVENSLDPLRLTLFLEPLFPGADVRFRSRARWPFVNFILGPRHRSYDGEGGGRARRRRRDGEAERHRGCSIISRTMHEKCRKLDIYLPARLR